jgi:hypothetical protein
MHAAAELTVRGQLIAAYEPHFCATARNAKVLLEQEDSSSVSTFMFRCSSDSGFSGKANSFHRRNAVAMARSKQPAVVTEFRS